VDLSKVNPLASLLLQTEALTSSRMIIESNLISKNQSNIFFMHSRIIGESNIFEDGSSIKYEKSFSKPKKILKLGFPKNSHDLEFTDRHKPVGFQL
jgi:hypothetical protein